MGRIQTKAIPKVKEREIVLNSTRIAVTEGTPLECCICLSPLPVGTKWWWLAPGVMTTFEFICQTCIDRAKHSTKQLLLEYRLMKGA